MDVVGASLISQVEQGLALQAHLVLLKILTPPVLVLSVMQLISSLAIGSTTPARVVRSELKGRYIKALLFKYRVTHLYVDLNFSSLFGGS